jgi:hypothetical protein
MRALHIEFDRRRSIRSHDKRCGNVNDAHLAAVCG